MLNNKSNSITNRLKLKLISLSFLIYSSVFCQEQGETNPIQNPENLTVFPVDDIASIRSQQTISSSALIDFVSTNSALTSWSQTGQTLSTSDPCVQSLGRRLTSGRVSTPKFEQAICVTPLGISLYYQPKPIAQGKFLKYQFSQPGVGINYRNFEAQTGLFNRTAGTDDLLHMDIVTAHRNLNGKLSVNIIGYDPAIDTSAQALNLRDNWVDQSTRQITGDISLSIGDYNGDGSLDILIWADTSTGTSTSTSGRIDMLSFSYDSTDRTLTHVGTIEIKTAGKPASIVSTSGDFATIGTDQAIMAYYLTNGVHPIHLSYFQLNSELKPAPAQIEKDMIGKPAMTSYFDIEAGLFAFDPNQTSSANGALGFHTRQLAMTWVDSSNKTKVSIVAVEEGGKKFVESGNTSIGRSEYITKTSSIGPNIAVGNFIGLQDENVSPIDQIAIAIPTIDSTVQNGTVTELTMAKVTINANTRVFTINQTDSIRESIFSVQGIVYGPGIAALDSLGRAFFLGNPAHIKVPSLIDPQYVVYMPPHHVDCLPNDSGDSCDVVNISSFSNFNVTLNDSQSSTIKQESTDTSSTDFGFGASINVSETVSASVLEIAKLSTTVQVSDAFSYESNSVKKDVNSNYQTITTQKSATTNIDDQLGFNQRIINIWRYPVFGLDLEQSEKYPYYEITIPGPLLPFQSDGLTVSWFSPRHINNNALSYPTIGDPNFPSDLGTFTYDDNGTEVSKSTPLNDGTIRSFAGNSQTFSLDYTQGSGGSSERSYNYNMSNTVDIKTGFSAKVGIGIVDSETKIDTSLKLTNKSSWGNSTVASRSMSESKGITLNQPSVPGIQTKAYAYQTLIYITGNGGIKVAHAVDFDLNTGRAWWNSTYKKADPALNLPLRLVQSLGSSDWQLNTDESYHWMRGISLTTNTINELTNTYPYLSGSVEEGEKVRVLVDVHNLSLVSTSSDTQVQFAYQALNPNTFDPVGPEVKFDTSAKIKLTPKSVQQVVGIWDTGKLSISESTPYRFIIRLITDEENDNHGAIAAAGGNNHGVWPYNNTGVFVFPKTSLQPVPETSKAIDMMLSQSNVSKFADSPDGLASISVKLIKKKASNQSYLSHEAHVTINSDTNHRGIVHIIVSQATGDTDGREIILASTMIWGLPKGNRTLKLGVPHTLTGGVKTSEIMSKGSIKVRLFSHHQQK